LERIRESTNPEIGTTDCSWRSPISPEITVIFLCRRKAHFAACFLHSNVKQG
jgi:hypothetical protein